MQLQLSFLTAMHNNVSFTITSVFTISNAMRAIQTMTAIKFQNNTQGLLALRVNKYINGHRLNQLFTCYLQQ